MQYFYLDRTFCNNKKCESKDRCEDYLNEERQEKLKLNNIDVKMKNYNCGNLDMEDKKI